MLAKKCVKCKTETDALAWRIDIHATPLMESRLPDRWFPWISISQTMTLHRVLTLHCFSCWCRWSCRCGAGRNVQEGLGTSERHRSMAKRCLLSFRVPSNTKFIQSLICITITSFKRAGNSVLNEAALLPIPFASPPGPNLLQLVRCQDVGAHLGTRQPYGH